NVANNTNLTFSAGDSTDPNDHVTEANFTWRFTPNLVDTRYGISPVYRYRQNGTYNVSLVMRETGGNVSFRNVTLYVDDQLPVAKIRTNRTGSGNANGLTLKVDQGIVVRFDGALSTDLAYPGTPGKISYAVFCLKKKKLQQVMNALAPGMATRVLELALVFVLA